VLKLDTKPREESNETMERKMTRTEMIMVLPRRIY